MSEKKDTIREMMKESYGPESCNPKMDIYRPSEKVDGAIHPIYYKGGGIEAIDVIEAWNLAFCLGNVVKYIARAGKKDANLLAHIQDLEKARWYLDREIKRISKV